MLIINVKIKGYTKSTLINNFYMNSIFSHLLLISLNIEESTVIQRKSGQGKIKAFNLAVEKEK